MNEYIARVFHERRYMEETICCSSEEMHSLLSSCCPPLPRLAERAASQWSATQTRGLRRHQPRPKPTFANGIKQPSSGFANVQVKDRGCSPTILLPLVSTRMHFHCQDKSKKFCIGIVCVNVLLRP